MKIAVSWRYDWSIFYWANWFAWAPIAAGGRIYQSMPTMLKNNAFKTCALQSFGVNYTPTGNYATYSDGVMVSYDLSMSFSEITPIFNDDYNIDDSFIGF